MVSFGLGRLYQQLPWWGAIAFSLFTISVATVFLIIPAFASQAWSVPAFSSLKWVSGTLSTKRPGSGPYHLEDHSGQDWAFYCDPEIVRYNNCISRDPAPSSSSQEPYRVGFFDHTHLYVKRHVLMFVQHGRWLLLPYSRQSLTLGERLEEDRDSAALYILIRLGAAAFLVVPTLIALWQKTG